jgi:hypothetical protein
MAKREAEGQDYDSEAAELAKKVSHPQLPRPENQARPAKQGGDKMVAHSPTLAIPEQMTSSVRYQATPSEKASIEEFVGQLNKEANTSLTVSNVLRACVDLLHHSRDELTRELQRADLKRPINHREAILAYERKLARVLHAALKAAPNQQG